MQAHLGTPEVMVVVAVIVDKSSTSTSSINMGCLSGDQSCPFGAAR